MRFSRTFLILAFPLVLFSCSKKETTSGPSPTPTFSARPSQSLAEVPPPTDTPEPLEYVLEDVKGTVLILDKGQNEPVTAEEEEVVDEEDEIRTLSGSEATLTLNENTLFHLSADSDVKVVELKPNTTQGFLSRLNLVKGKVLSEVEKLSDSHSTFEVEAGGVVCGVRGTGFEVQKDGPTVHTRTFHGLVEMRQGTRVLPVKAGTHGIFQGQQGHFLPPRPLAFQEKRAYQGWLRKKEVVQQKQVRRTEALAAFQRLPADQKQKFFENMKGTNPRDRMRLLHQTMRQRSPGFPGMNHAPVVPKVEKKKWDPGVVPGGKPRPGSFDRQGHPRALEHPGGAKVGGPHPSGMPAIPRKPIHGSPVRKDERNFQRHPAQPDRPGVKQDSRRIIPQVPAQRPRQLQGQPQRAGQPAGRPSKPNLIWNQKPANKPAVRPAAPFQQAKPLGQPRRPGQAAGRPNLFGGQKSVNQPMGKPAASHGAPAKPLFNPKPKEKVKPGKRPEEKRDHDEK